MQKSQVLARYVYKIGIRNSLNNNNNDFLKQVCLCWKYLVHARSLDKSSRYKRERERCQRPIVALWRRNYRADPSLRLDGIFRTRERERNKERERERENERERERVCGWERERLKKFVPNCTVVKVYKRKNERPRKRMFWAFEEGDRDEM